MEPNPLTAALQSRIVAAIRAGGYAHIAAEAAGIGRRTFWRWLKLGRGKKASEPYAAFAVEVRSAEAQARLCAEVHVLKDDPRIWLEHGPGRETRGNPGWSSPVKAVEPERGADKNLFLNAHFMRGCNFIRDALKPYPDALASVTDAIAAAAKQEPTNRSDKPWP
jgi:hypothetical protein